MQNVAVQDPPVNASVELTDDDHPSVAVPTTMELQAPPRALPMFGPVGRHRSPVAVVALSVVTLGVASLGWLRRVNREMEEFDPQLHARPGRTLLAVIVPWVAGLLTTLAGALLVVTNQVGVRLPLDPHLANPLPYLLLGGLVVVPYLVAILPFSVVSVVMTLERLRSVQEHAGLTVDRQVRPVKSSLLLYVPVVGGLVLLGRAQSRLNAVWEIFSPTGHISR